MLTRQRKHEILSGSGQFTVASYWLNFVRDVVAFEECCEDSARTKGIGVEGYEDQDWW